MGVVLLGPPGAGKGTQASRLAGRLGVPHIATGDILRAAGAAGTPLGARAREYMDRGELVPDPVMIPLVEERLGAADAREGYVLDGFPRTLPQGEALEESLRRPELHPIDHAVLLDVPEKEIVHRLAGRRTCPQCGRVYHVDGDPPAVCQCGGTLVQRADDAPETTLRRLAVYREQTAPLLDFYRRRNLLRAVPGTGAVDAVEARLSVALGASP